MSVDLSFVNNTQCFEDEKLERHKDWLTHALSSYQPHVQGTLDEWLERVHVELNPVQRVKLLMYAAYLYTRWSKHSNPHVTAALFQRVDPTYSFLVLIWQLCSTYHYKSDTPLRDDPSELLSILLKVHATEKQWKGGALSFEWLHSVMRYYWGTASSKIGKFLWVLSREDSRYMPTGYLPILLQKNWNAMVEKHFAK